MSESRQDKCTFDSGFNSKKASATFLLCNRWYSHGRRSPNFQNHSRVTPPMIDSPRLAGRAPKTIKLISSKRHGWISNIPIFTEKAAQCKINRCALRPRSPWMRQGPTIVEKHTDQSRCNFMYGGVSWLPPPSRAHEVGDSRSKPRDMLKPMFGLKSKWTSKAAVGAVRNRLCKGIV